MIRRFSIAILVLVATSTAYAQEEIRKSKRGWADLGVRLEDKNGAATVVEILDGAAAKAGIKVGDAIVGFDGKDKPASDEIMAALWALPLDRAVRVQVRAGGDVTVHEIQPDVIDGQRVPGVNDKVHHPPAIRAAAVAAEKLGEGAKHPAVYAFDLTMSFDWDLSEEERKQATEMVEEAARIWYDALEGQMYWRRVEIRVRKEGWDRAQYRVRRSRMGHAGIEHVTPGGQCALNFGRLDRTAAWVFVHEAGHMQLGSGDEYPYGGGRKTCRCLMGGNQSIELCVKDGHDYRQKESCWDNARRWYPNLRPVTETAKGPALKRLPEIVFAGEKRSLEDDVMKVVDERLAKLREEIVRMVREALAEGGKKEPEREPEAERKPGYLGIGPDELTEEDEDALKKLGYDGAVKVQLMDEEAPAAKGGMKDGDLLAEFEGTKVTDVEDLRPLVQKHGAGREARVTVVRDGKKLELKVTLGAYPEDQN